MILYKYRSLQNLNHVLDILHHSRLHCARYFELNDPFEGLFSAVIHMSHLERMKFSLFLPDTVTLTKSIDDLPFSEDSVRICSLSSSLSEVRLWAYYADGNRGIVLEIDFSGMENSIHEVKYSERLPDYSFTILTAPSAIEVLTHKTVHWSYESEFRIIRGEEFFDISDRLKAIYIGSRIKDTHLALLERMKRPDIPIIHTEVDLKTVEIRAKRGTEQGGTANRT